MTADGPVSVAFSHHLSSYQAALHAGDEAEAMEWAITDAERTKVRTFMARRRSFAAASRGLLAAP